MKAEHRNLYIISIRYHCPYISSFSSSEPIAFLPEVLNIKNRLIFRYNLLTIIRTTIIDNYYFKVSCW